MHSYTTALEPIESILRTKYPELHFAIYGGKQVRVFFPKDQRAAIADSAIHTLEEMISLIDAALVKK
jgi:hypothetical protein